MRRSLHTITKGILWGLLFIAPMMAFAVKSSLTSKASGDLAHLSDYSDQDLFQWLEEEEYKHLLLLDPDTVPYDTTESKFKYWDKLGHWFEGYGYTQSGFLDEEATAFKRSAFTNVYLEPIIDHKHWMFWVTNKITKASNLQKTAPYVLIQPEFVPTDDEFTSYGLRITLKGSPEVQPYLSTIQTQANTELQNATADSPGGFEQALKTASSNVLNSLATALGTSLAPPIVIGYEDGILLDGDVVQIYEGLSDDFEFQSLDNQLQPLDDSRVSWQNASKNGSMATTSMTGVTRKEVSVSYRGYTSIITIVKRGDILDLKSILKDQIIAVMRPRKEKYQDTLRVDQENLATLDANLIEQLGLIEKGNLPLVADASLAPEPVFDEPFTVTDSSTFLDSEVRRESFRMLRQKKNLEERVRKRINVLAFADLIVDNPEQLDDLADAIIRNSGRVLAQILFDNSSSGQEERIRNIIVDFLNANIEQMANSSSVAVTAVPIQLPVVEVTETPTFDLSVSRVYMNPLIPMTAQEKTDFITEMDTYLATLDQNVFVNVRYSQDVSASSYESRIAYGRPEGLPEDYEYITIDYVNIPGSVKKMLYGSGSTGGAPEGDGNSTLQDVIKTMLTKNVGNLSGADADEEILRMFEYIRCGYVSGQQVSFKNPRRLVYDVNVRLKNGQEEYVLVDFVSNRISVLQKIEFDPRQSVEIKEDYYRIDPIAWRSSSPDFAFEYMLKEGVGLRIYSNNRESITNILNYLRPGLTQWQNQTNASLDELLAEVAKGPDNWDDDKVRELVFTMGCGLESTQLTAQNKYDIIKVVSSDVFGTDDFDENIILDLLQSTTDPAEAKKLVKLLNDDEDGLLATMESEMDNNPNWTNREYDDYYKALIDLFLRANGSEAQDMVSKVSKELDNEQYANLLEQNFKYAEYLSKANVFIWSDPGIVKFLFQTDLTAVDYQDLEIADNGNISFEVDHINWLGTDYDFEVGPLRAFDPVIVIVLTTTSDINPYTDGQALIRGQWIILPAISMGHLDSKENMNHYMRVFDVVTAVIPITYAYRAGRFAFLAAELTIFAVQQVVEDYYNELSASPEGKVFLRAWMVVNLMYSIADMSGAFNGVSKATKKLEESYSALKNADNGDQLKPFFNSMDEMLAARKADALFISDDAIDMTTDVRNHLRYLENGSKAGGTGFTDLIIHGDGAKFIIDGGESVDVARLAEILANRSPKQTIRLLSCSSLESAKDLARRLDVEIIANSGITRVHGNGQISAVSAVDGLPVEWKRIGRNGQELGSAGKHDPASVSGDFIELKLIRETPMMKSLKEIFGIDATIAKQLEELPNASRLFEDQALKNRILALGDGEEGTKLFLKDLTRRPERAAPYIGERIADLDNDMIRVWEILKNERTALGNPGSLYKRIEFDYLNQRKTWTKEQILDDLRIDARTRLAQSIREVCPGCAQAIDRASQIGPNTKRMVKDLIARKVPAPNGMTWDQVYLKYVDETGYDAFKNGDNIDWEKFFSIGGYQGHHKFPVNLFANEQGAWRFMFENMPDGRKQELATWFNSADNGIMVPNKRVIDGVEYVIHTNHARYEQAIIDYLNRRRTAYLASPRNYSMGKVSELLFSDVQTISKRLDELIVEKSLLGHTNINNLDLSGILR